MVAVVIMMGQWCEVEVESACTLGLPHNSSSCVGRVIVI